MEPQLASVHLCCQAVYAHGVCLTDDELRLMAARGSAIAHCPLSNMFFADRLLKCACPWGSSALLLECLQTSLLS